MTQLCAVSGLVIDGNGAPLAGAAILAARVRLAGARQTTYEVPVSTDSNGAFSFTVPQGSQVRFSSFDVSAINNFNFNAPNANAVNIGNFRADVASEAGARDGSTVGSVPAAVQQYVSAREVGNGAMRKIILTCVGLPVTLVKNGTSSGGGGTKVYTFQQGLIGPYGGSSNLTVANALDKSFVAGVGSAAAGTDGTLTGTEISFLPSTAATTTSGAGTCKMKATSTTPTPGAKLDGTTTPVDVYMNAALGADATGAEALTFSGTITILASDEGDN